MTLTIVALTAAVLMFAERRSPGVRLTPVVGFVRRALVLNALQIGAIVLAGLTWDRWLSGGPELLSLSERLPPVAAGLVGYVVTTFIYYWWHRARHRSSLLWRTCHQLHHSPSRIEILTAFYKHPLEQIANTILSAAIAYPLLGLSPAAAAVATLLCGLAELVYHVNLTTPRWLGWLIQRPEMHRIHHERGRHSGNYGDLPLWDMIFGTYVNPETFDGPCGFDGDREQRLGDMLAFRDVNAPTDTEADASRRDWRTVGLAVWIAFGLSHAAGATLALAGGPKPVANAIAGPGRALLASPAPKVFCRLGDLEPFAYRHRVTVEADGKAEIFELDRARYAEVEGPYALRNVYGAALVFGPLLPERTTMPVLHHAACRAGALRAPSNASPDRVTVSSWPRPGALGAPFDQTVICDGGTP